MNFWRINLSEILKESKGIRLLLENFWLIRDNNREEYYEIKDNRLKIERFFSEKLGWKLIFNNRLTKLEKTPARAESFMGIAEFKDTMDYCILCSLLMILEDKEDGEQFLLSSLTDRIKIYIKEYIEIDWLNYSHRQSLVRAFKYAESIGLIRKNDGDITKYNNSVEIEVLYEKTGFSRYFAVDFQKDISNYTSYKDFETEKIEDISMDKGEQRTNRIYRNLLTTPAVYWEETKDADSIYIRNQKPALEGNLKKYLLGNLHVHKNSAFLGFDDEDLLGEIHPKKRGTLSDIVLLICGELRKKIVNQELKREIKDFVEISKAEMISIIEESKNRYGINWSKEYRDMKLEKLYENIIEYMEEWKFIEKVSEDKLIIYPAVGKVIGKYRKVKKGVNDE